MSREDFKYNLFAVEAKLIIKYVDALRMFGVQEKDIGIIAPYAAQVWLEMFLDDYITFLLHDTNKFTYFLSDDSNSNFFSMENAT